MNKEQHHIYLLKKLNLEENIHKKLMWDLFEDAPSNPPNDEYFSEEDPQYCAHMDVIIECLKRIEQLKNELKEYDGKQE